MLDDGHRVLVFSQFVHMLKLLEEWLQREKVDYCYLDGSTKDRAGAVDRFQTGDVPVFLISLKAGGVGLNLTAADTVIHFDPWWNPAVEAQATDRAHRIGQRKSSPATNSSPAAPSRKRSSTCRPRSARSSTPWSKAKSP